MILLGLAVFLDKAAGAVPPPESLLPKDALLVITTPDFSKARAFVTNTSYGRLWHDPALKAFRDNFVGKFTSDALKPMEQNLGIKFADYAGLAQGQMTFALLPAEPNNPEHLFDRVFLLDTKDHAAQLRTNLAGLVKKWSDAGKPTKTQKIREVEFTTLVASPDDFSWGKIFGNAKSADPSAGAAKGKNAELTFGQSDSLLIVSDSTDAIEKVLNRQSGGLLPSLEENGEFRSDFEARLRNSPIYAWVNMKMLMDNWANPPAAGDDSAASHLGPLLSTTGLNGISSASLSYQDSGDGLGVQFFVRAPEDKRKGLLQALASETKDASPPPFVPSDAAKYWRWRVNLSQSWGLLTDMIGTLNPQIMAVLNFVLEHAGKDKDEHYDLKAELLGNLGDDVICYQKAPQGDTLADLKSAPALYLIGSPDPEKLAAAVKVALEFLTQGGGGIKDREFLGRKIYAATFGSSGETTGPTLSFCGSGGYVALSSDTGILEQYLRSGDNPPKALADTPGLREAAQNAGGMGNGWFGYENQNAKMRPAFNLLRAKPAALSDIFSQSAPMMGGMSPADQMSKLNDWADFSLLPPFDDVSKYFYYSVYSGSFSPEGFTLKIFAPTPPGLR